MKISKSLLLSITLFLGARFANTYAQTGWKWGIASSSTSILYEGISATVDKSGNVFATGWGAGVGSLTIGATSIPFTLSGEKQLIVIKADSSGHFLWAIGIPCTNPTSVGLVTDSGGNVYMLGVYDAGTCVIGTITLSSSYTAYYLTKISPSGTPVWAHNVCSDGTYDTNNVIAPINPLGSLGIDAAGYLYIAGSFIHPAATIGSTMLHNHDLTGVTSDIFLAKYDSSGTAIWAKNYGGDNSDGVEAMAVTPAGAVYISAVSNSDTLTIGSTTLYGTYYYILNLVSFFTKFDSSGNPIWTQQYNNHIGYTSITADAYENYYAAGIIDSSIVLGTTLIIDSVSLASGANPFLVAKYDSAGHVVWSNSASHTAHTAASDIGNNIISLDHCGNIWVCGHLVSPMDFNGVLLYAPPGSSDAAFMAEYNNSGTHLSSIALPTGGDDASDIVVTNTGDFYFAGDNNLVSMVIGPDTIPAPFEEQLFIAKYQYGANCTCFHSPVAGFTNTGVTADSFTYTGTLPVDSVKWIFGDGSTSTLVNSRHGYAVADSYHVCLVAYNACGNDTVCHEVHIATSGISPITTTELSIYPNPVLEVLTIAAQNGINQIVITNLIGQTVYANQCNAKKVQIDVSILLPGVYFVRVNGGEMKKFVKE